MNRTPTAVLGLALLIGAAAPAIGLAQEAMPEASAVVVGELSGKVVFVNTETRLMTLKDADGEYHVLHVPPEVTRLDKLKRGDKVSITEISSVLVELTPGAAAPPASELTTTIDRTPGRKPGGTITDTLTVHGNVVGLNKRAGELTIEGPEGRETLQVEDLSVLEGVKVGDGVVARFRNVIIGEVK